METETAPRTAPDPQDHSPAGRRRSAPPTRAQHGRARADVAPSRAPRQAFPSAPCCRRLWHPQGDRYMAYVVADPCVTVSYTHLRAHETPEHLVCRLLLEKKKCRLM